MVEAIEHVAARQQRHVRPHRERGRGMLEPEGADMLRARSDEADAFGGKPLGEGDILGQKTVAGMHGLRAGLAAGGDDRVDVEISLRRRTGAEPHQAVHAAHDGGETVGVRRHAGGRDAELAQGPRDAARDFAAIGDQHRVDFQDASQISTRRSVGSKPLQGLFTCGQLEMTHNTSISARSST